MLEGLLHHKKEEKEYLCALVVAEDRIDGAIWEASKEGKVTVLKTAQKAYAGDWEKGVDAADQVVTEIETALPTGTELTKVVFGLYPEWVSEDHIRDTYLKKLKQLTTALSLVPQGFVELPIAVSHLLQKDEGTQQTVILVGVESKHVTLSLFKIGKLIGSVTEERTEAITADIEKMLATFTTVEVLPSRVLLYGSDTSLEKLKAELLNHPWQKKANFLHFPKIEVLNADFPVKAVAIASATEIIPQQPETTAEAPSAGPAETAATSEEVEEIAEDLGFVPESETPSKESSKKEVMVETAVAEANVEPVSIPKPHVPEAEVKGKVPGFSLPKFSFTFKLPRFPKMGLAAIGVGLLLLLLGGWGGLYWLAPAATVRLLVTPQVFDKSETITVDAKATAVNTQDKILPGKPMTVEVTGTSKVDTTGKKTVGDKAKGEVTIYNKTLNTKLFKQGTVITAGKLKFTLNGDVNVASASEGVGSLTYGTTKAEVTATDIGAAANVPSGTEFAFTDLPTTSYSARNEKAFAGGSSREISVVARDDQQSVREQTLAQITPQAEKELRQKLTAGQKLLDNSLQTKVLKEAFSKEIGEEADSVSADMTVSATGIIYQQDDFYTLLTAIISSNVPPNYEYKKEEAKFSVEGTPESKADTYIFTARIKVNLIPKVETADLTKKLAGRSISEATEYLRSQPTISGVEFSVNAPFGFLKDKLPANSSRIKIETSAL